MLEGLARLGDVGTRIINQSAANTIADLQLLQPILTQLAAAGPDLAGSLELLLSYPFPDSSLSALNYREAQTGGYALFTNMTATVDLDLSHLLCRYVDRPGTGALDRAAAAGGLAQGECGVRAAPPGNDGRQPAPRRTSSTGHTRRSSTSIAGASSWTRCQVLTGRAASACRRSRGVAP